MEIGVDPNEAVTAGQQVETISESFAGLIKEFQATVENAEAVAVEAPCRRGYGPFGETNTGAMAKVEEHGVTLGGNVQAGGAEAGITDAENATDFTTVREALRMQINHYTDLG